MSDPTFETFLVSGLLVLIAAVAFLAWAAWRWVDRERDMQGLAMAGVGHEFRHNLKRMMSELAGLADGTVSRDIEIVPVVHPQLDALLSRPNEADRTGLTTIRGLYNELSAHKQSLRLALVEQTEVGVPANIAADAVIDSLAMLYLWEEHKGCMPEVARSTRSWDVRDWMKANKFHADTLPGMHLRDQVVERLRNSGMTLTPKPLTYTASEYFAKQYDRKADPNAPFWKRKPKPAPAVEVEVEPEPVPKGIVDIQAAIARASGPAAAAQLVPETAPETAPAAAGEVEVSVEAAPTPELEPITEFISEEELAPGPAPEVQAEPELESAPEPMPEPLPDTITEDPLPEVVAMPDPEPVPAPETPADPLDVSVETTDPIAPLTDSDPSSKPTRSGAA
ncbi:MAG: hypothetical protein AAF996_09780 [Pseudomonadota bacterium]